MTTQRLLLPTSSPLRSAALQPATLSSYDKHLSTFLRHTRLTLKQLLSASPRRIDRALAAYMDWSYQHGGSYDYASHTLNALIFYSPSLRLRLGESRLRLRGWSRIRPSTSHPPITWELTVLFAVTLAKWRRIDQAVACLLSFHCFLRVGELTRLRYRDIIQPFDSRLGSAHTGMALRLAETKTGKNQGVAIESGDISSIIVCYITRYFGSGEHNPLVFPFSPSSLRLSLRQLCAEFGLASIPFVPHSFRHGGATCAHLLGATIEQIMYRGRWKSMESARRYIQTGRALYADQAVPSALVADGRLLAQGIVNIITTIIQSDSSSPLLRRPATPTHRVRFRL